MKPNCPNLLTNLAHCYRGQSQELAKQFKSDESMKSLQNARQVSRYLKTVDQSAFVDATNWVYNDNSKLPTPFE